MTQIQRTTEEEYFKSSDRKFFRKIWDVKSDVKLLTLVNQYQGKKLNWKEIGNQLNKTRKQCYSRYLSIKPGIARGKWTDEEDRELLNNIFIHGKKWAFISKLMKNRTGKQIRDRYNNCLDQKIVKAKFTNEEDDKILKYYKLYGPKWSKISKKLNGRTGDSVKNRFYTRHWKIFISEKCQNAENEPNVDVKKKRRKYKTKRRLRCLANNDVSLNNKIKLNEEMEISKESTGLSQPQDNSVIQQLIEAHAYETFKFMMKDLQNTDIQSQFYTIGGLIGKLQKDIEGIRDLCSSTFNNLSNSC